MRPARLPLFLVVVTVVAIMVGCSDGSDDASTSAPIVSQPDATPAGSAAGPHLTVQESTFAVRYRLDGTVEASSGARVDVPNGTEFEPLPGIGKTVEKGDDLGQLTVETGPVTKGTVALSQLRLAEERASAVKAPVGGRVEIDGEMVRIEKPGLDVVVSLRPLQELRYLGMEFAGTASVETVLGRREAECQALWIDRAGGESADADSGDGASGTAQSAVHCRLAPDVETASGLPAVLTLTTVPLKGVMSIPLIYIGLDKTGADYVVRLRKGDEYIQRAVVVGITDGARRVIRSGLHAGDELEPFPVS